MKQLFKKAAIMSDLHLGLKTNSKQHNEDCLNFLQWFVEQAHNNDCDMCIFLGDYFHNRNNTNLVTMSYGLQGLRILSDAFKQTIMIPGNHDLYFKDKRDVSSIAWGEHIPNITILNDITAIADTVFVPWLIQDETKILFKNKGMYMFGHFELPKFLMNSMVEMPEVGELRAEHFENYHHVYTGHFHKRQTKNNITYVGSPFGHNYGDAGDDERGMMILPWGEEPKFLSWPDAPKYRIVKITDLVTNPADYLAQYGYIKVLLDTNITYEEAAYLKENLIEEFDLRELNLVNLKTDAHIDDTVTAENLQFQSIDAIVQNQIIGISSDFYETSLLLNIYQNL